VATSEKKTQKAVVTIKSASRLKSRRRDVPVKGAPGEAEVATVVANYDTFSSAIA
jgi:molybdopterin/thiamine biosynthesis adenylyltransferase